MHASCFAVILFSTLFKVGSLKALLLNTIKNTPVLASMQSNQGRNCKYDVWIVGAGTLGEEILQQLHIKQLGLQVAAENHREQRALRIAEYGAMHKLRSDRTPADNGAARNVIVCLPPSCDNYLEEIRDATLLWAGRGAGGSLIYTSSIGVYGNAQRVITEESTVDTSTPAATRLLAAEDIIRSAGGKMIRLAGLYTATRGPHAYWLHRARDAKSLKDATITGAADAVVNLLHYEDAASAVLALMTKPDSHDDTFLACEDQPLSREEICRSALASGLYADCPMPLFAEDHGPPGKICDSSWTRTQLNWRPQHTSFRTFMRGLGRQGSAEEFRP